jgi:hypothetical protein
MSPELVFFDPPRSLSLMPPVLPVSIETGPSSFSGVPGLIDEQDARKINVHSMRSRISSAPKKKGPVNRPLPITPYLST